MRPDPQTRIRIVQSTGNRWVKSLRAALTHPPGLARQASDEEPALIALEGFHLLTEALRSGLTPSAIFLRAGEEAATLRTLLAVHPELPSETELLALPPALFESLMQTEAPQPVAALLPHPVYSPEQVFAHPQPALLLVLCGLQDPGNLGTLLRSAEAFGATGALLLPSTATPWSGKSLRASAGSALRIPLHAPRDAAEAASLLRAHGIGSYAAMPSGGQAPAQAALHQPIAFWIGNEGAGLRPQEIALCDASLTLPMPGPTESLNAAVAGSLLLYEASCRRAAHNASELP